MSRESKRSKAIHAKADRTKNYPLADTLGRTFKVPVVLDNDVNVGTYGRMIHEMTEMVASNMGQYAHGNQPIQHMIYLYNYAGQPWKTQARAREVMTRLYQPTPDGFCGDEDTGQMSSGPNSVNPSASAASAEG